MDKNSAKSIVDMAKKVGPVVKKYAPLAATIIQANPAIKEKINETVSKINVKKSSNTHLRKIKYNEYGAVILPKLQEMNYIQLKGYIEEVKSFIRQIENEEITKINNAKLKNKRIANWKKVLMQIEDKNDSKSYVELYRLYNQSDIKSDFFEEKIVVDFKNITNKEDLVIFIQRFTKKTEQEINQEFY